MTEHKWTPGPWILTPDSDGEEMCFVSPSTKDASEDAFPRNWLACMCVGLPNSEWQANAHLISAAPDLYDALENAFALILTHGNSKQIEDAETALSKARGE